MPELPKLNLLLFLLLTLFLSPHPVSGQEQPDYFYPDYFRCDDHVYVPHIRTVMLHRAGWELSAPQIALATEEKLLLSFDDLQGGRQDYRYTLIHCDAAWRPSELLPSDYLQGFTEGYITDYQASYNTLQRYTHYSLLFPEDEVKPLLSGNYLLKIYAAERPDEPLITRRFLIVEELVSIRGRVHAATEIEDRDYRQEIDFSIDLLGYAMDQPYRNLKVVVQQNGRWDNAITGMQPRMMNGGMLDYDLESGNVFDGLNEFRHVDLKSLRYLTDRVMQILEDDTSYTLRVQPDLRRPFQVYSLDRDINGRFLVKVNEGTDSRVEAEYVRVEFTLPYESPLLNGNVYLIGAFTAWGKDPEARMRWDPRHKAYLATLYLKQGYYNYLYGYLEDGQSFSDAALIEGTHQETENDYTILAYYRETGGRYDRLIGITQLNSLTDR